MRCLKTVKPEQDNAVYLYMLKKESEGKAKKVAKIAALNKFLRIYYARVKSVYKNGIFLDSEQEASVATAAGGLPFTGYRRNAKLPTPRRRKASHIFEFPSSSAKSQEHFCDVQSRVADFFMPLRFSPA